MLEPASVDVCPALLRISIHCLSFCMWVCCITMCKIMRQNKYFVYRFCHSMMYVCIFEVYIDL